MSVQIHLDQHNGPFYTNLDFISGRVILSLNGDVSISVINVKLEGESRSKLAGQRHPHERPDRVKTEFELHKLLYKVQTVFPSQEVLQHASPNAQFTLGAGLWEYPFRFKFPFNSDCKNTQSALQDLKFGQLKAEFMQGPVTHLKRALPPSMGGFPGEADIRYFVKATVVRPKFYHENLRVEHMIKFLPIEPIRPKTQAEERYARRQHQFQSPKRSSVPGLFTKSSDPDNGEPLGVRVDARLPNPSILTCHQPIPLRVLIERTTSSQANIYLNMLHIELIASTQVKAGGLRTTETTNIVLASHANMEMVLGERVSEKTKQIQIPTRLWGNIPLPSTAIPSFETCNLSRRYELEVRVGLTHSLADKAKPEVIFLPLRIPCQVYSGIMPPHELLQRMNPQGGAAGINSSPSSMTPVSIASNTNIHVSIPPTPITPMMDNTLSPAIGNPYQPNHQTSEDLDDLPPSYEDAMAEDIGPVDGPRQHFETSLATAAQRQQPAYSGDSKSSSGGGLNRHPSERLFAQNAPRAPGTSPRSLSHSHSLSSQQTNTVFEEPLDNYDTEYNHAQQKQEYYQNQIQPQTQSPSENQHQIRRKTIGTSVNNNNNNNSNNNHTHDNNVSGIIHSTANMSIATTEGQPQPNQSQGHGQQHEQEQEPQPQPPPPLPTRTYSTQ